MIELKVNNQDIAGLLTQAPLITDDIEGVCRSLEFEVYAANGLVNFMGQPMELWVGGKRWFYGFLEVRGWEAEGRVHYKVYDPLYFLKRNPKDYYFKNMTANQIAAQVLSAVGVKAGKLASTGAVLPPKLYQKADGDKVIIDTLARTYRSNSKKFWFRFNPDAAAFGAEIYERKAPELVWAFERGRNLTGARYEESLEETYNIVRLVNRETGKVVQKIDAVSMKNFGARTFIEEVEKDKLPSMEKRAGELLDEKKKVKVTISVAGVNMHLAMPQLFSGDVIYIQEDITQIFGAYHIRNISQTIESERLIQLAMEVQAAPDIPAIQFPDEEAKEKAEKTAKAKESKGVKESDAVQEIPEYSDEVKKQLEKYLKK